MQETSFPTSPTVVQLDGIWVTVQSQGEKIKQDARKRKRKQRTGKKIVILVALGLWKDGTREILDWQVASSEDHTHWEVLLNRLWKREVQPEKGLQMIVRDGSGGLEEAVALIYGKSVLDQRCVFHKLKNVGDKVRSELKGEEKREKRKQIMQQAKMIYQADSALQARYRFRCGESNGVNMFLKRLQRWGEILSTHWSITSLMPLLVNGYAPRRCLNALIENCDGNFVKPLPSEVRLARRSPCISKSNDSTLDGPMHLGGRFLMISFLRLETPTLREGYDTFPRSWWLLEDGVVWRILTRVADTSRDRFPSC